MKYSISTLIICTLISCGGSSEQQNKDSESSPEIQQETVVEDLKESKGSIDISAIPNFKDNLLLKIQTYILSKNVLEAERQNVVVKSVSMDDQCSKMELVYEWKHTATAWETSEDFELSDRSDFRIGIDILEASENAAKVKLNIIKYYEEHGVNYYGQKYEIADRADYQETVGFQFQSDMDFGDNKVSSVYNAIRGRKVKRAELLSFSIDELGYLRNEFYARKGYQFKTEKMQNYFSAQDWYTPTEKDLEGLLDSTELENVFYIKAIEAEIRMDASADEKSKLSTVFETAQSRALTDADLSSLTVHQLSYLRNEFYARKGYKFKSERLAKYFTSTDWYTAEVDNVDDLLTDLDKQNIQFIKAVELVKR